MESEQHKRCPTCRAARTLGFVAESLWDSCSHCGFGVGGKATRATGSAKLHRSATCACSPGNRQRSVGAIVPFMPLLRSLAGLLRAAFYKHGAPNGAWPVSAAENT